MTFHFHECCLGKKKSLVFVSKMNRTGVFISTLLWEGHSVKRLNILSFPLPSWCSPSFIQALNCHHKRICASFASMAALDNSSERRRHVWAESHATSSEEQHHYLNFLWPSNRLQHLNVCIISSSINLYFWRNCHPRKGVKKKRERRKLITHTCGPHDRLAWSGLPVKPSQSWKVSGSGS